MAEALVNLIELRAVEPLGSAAKVDREAGVIRGVKVMGTRSPNRVGGKPTRYAEKAFAESVSLYNQAAVYVDHPDRDKPHAERRYADRLGRLENVTAKPDGLYGDLRVNKAHRLAEQVFQDAEMGSSVGLSHNAQGVGLVEGEEFVVSAIKAVRSVDLVAEPATTRSLFESQDKEAPVADEKKPDAAPAAPAAPTVQPVTVTVTTTEAKKPDAPAPEVVALQESLKKAQAELDALKVRESERERAAKVDALLVESKLPARAVTVLFREQLASAKDDAAAKALIEERKALVFHQTPGAPPVGAGAGKPIQSTADFLEAVQKARS